MDPIDLGARVVEAIKDNRFNILPHAEFLDEVRERHREIEADFAKGEEIPPERTRFETTRRETVNRLFDMPAKD